jgi:hypothetical protein
MASAEGFFHDEINKTRGNYTVNLQQGYYKIAANSR